MLVAVSPVVGCVDCPVPLCGAVRPGIGGFVGLLREGEIVRILA